MENQKAPLEGMQVLRAVAALWVVVTHISIISVGVFGVDIFFVISGFIITMVSYQETASDFALKRLFRVVPLYWFCTIFIYLVALTLPSVLNSTTTDPVALIKSLLFIPFLKGSGAVQPVLFQGWTLNYEMLFYLAFFVSLLIAPKRPVIPLILIILGLIALGVVLAPKGEPFRFWTSPMMFEFLYGVGLYQVWRARWCPRLRLSILLGGAILLQVLLACGGFGLPFGRQVNFGIPAAMLVFLVLCSEGQIKWPAWLLLVGDASYSLYLLHPYVVIPLQKVGAHVAHSILGQVLLAPIWISFAVGIAIVFFKLVEVPSNRWLRKAFLDRARSPIAWKTP